MFELIQNNIQSFIILLIIFVITGYCYNYYISNKIKKMIRLKHKKYYKNKRNNKKIIDDLSSSDTETHISDKTEDININNDIDSYIDPVNIE